MNMYTQWYPNDIQVDVKIMYYILLALFQEILDRLKKI